MEIEPKRPWWRKKRWVAAGLLLLTVSYPLSLGPVMYAAGRGWVGGSATEAIYAPVMHVLNEANSTAESAKVTVRYEAPDGRTVTAHGRSELPWWASAGAAVTGVYWDGCVWFGEAGIRHARRADVR